MLDACFGRIFHSYAELSAGKGLACPADIYILGKENGLKDNVQKKWRGRERRKATNVWVDIAPIVEYTGIIGK